MVAILSFNRIYIKLCALRFQVGCVRKGQELKGAEAMSETDSKQKFGGNGNKSRFGGGTAIRYGGEFRQNQLKEKGSATGLEHVCFVTNKSNAKMMTQFRKGTDVLATYVGKEFGEEAGPLAAKC